MNIIQLITAFGGGMLGAAIGGVPAFVFTGLTVIIAIFAGESGMPGRLVGAIDMMDNYTFVDVPAKHAEAVLAAMNDNVLIKGRKVNVEKANVSAKPARKSKSKPDTRRRKDESRGKHDKLKERRSKSGKVRRNGEKY